MYPIVRMCINLFGIDIVVDHRFNIVLSHQKAVVGNVVPGTLNVYILPDNE